MAFNNSQQVQTITLIEDAFALPIPEIPEILHSTGDVVILASLLTHCVLTKDVYFQSIIRMPAWIFLTLLCCNHLRLKDERCAVLQELFRLGIILYYGMKLNLTYSKVSRFLRSNSESATSVLSSECFQGKRERSLSEEEVERFYKGVPTLVKGNGLVAYYSLPYDKTLEISHAHITASTLNYNGRKVRACVKTSIPGDMESLRGLMKEAKLLKFVGQHDNLQTIFGACTNDIGYGKLVLVLENCGSRTLTMQLNTIKQGMNDLKSPTKAFSDDLLVDFYRWAYEISSGMKFISSKGIVHGMLTCDCIFLNEVGTVKLTDFGTAPYLSDPEKFQPEQWNHNGWKYLAPEAIIKNDFTTSADVWSFGVVLWKIFSVSSDPYPAFDVYSKIFSLSLLDGMRPEAQERIPSYIFDLLGKCWLHEPERRPTFDMCCQYTYVKTRPKRRIVTCDGDFIT